MKGIIYYKNKIAGKIQLDKIISNYATLNIPIAQQQQSLNNIFTTFTNGDTWDLIHISPTSRSKSCNIAYIENTISTEIIDTIIFPTIKSLPYTAYHYYN